MGEGNDMPNKSLTFEEKLGKYKNRMELLRTIIGVILLCIQIMIIFNLLKK